MDSVVDSPVTGGPASVCDEFACADLVERYRNDWGLDVAAHFAGMDHILLYRCEETGYRFFHPPELAGEAAFYDQFWALENPTIHRPKDAWRADWQFALERLKPGERVLDVGSADGAFLERAAEIANAEGIDANEQGCLRARRAGLKVTCSTVTDYAASNAGAFDVVAASQVLEHVYDVATFVQGLKTLARPGGRIILSVPNNQPYYAGWSKYEPLNNPPHHIGLWNERSLRAMAAHFALDVAELGYLGPPDSLKLQLYRRASHLAGVIRAPNQLTAADWVKLGLASPLALLLTGAERARRSTCNHAYLAIVLVGS